MSDNTSIEQTYSGEIVDNGNKRYGISALSKQNKDIAYNEEIMVHKSTGEILIKTPDSDIISYGYNSRLYTNLELLTINAFNNGIYGKIYSITPDIIDENGSTVGEYDLPDVISFNKNIIDNCTLNTSIDGSFKFKKFMINIDLDCILINTYEYINKRIYPKVILKYKVQNNDIIEYETTIDELNSHVFETSPTGINNDELTLVSLTIINDDLSIGDWRLILNNILIIVD